MNNMKQGWFSELSSMWPGQAFSLEVKHSILDKHSKYQHIQIFESLTYGKVLVLDGVIQLTERDEASYQEMLAFLPLNSHPNPKRVLIVGGGDGGIVREVSKHPSVKEIVMCEIDQEVVQACKDHIPSMSSGFSDPRLTLHFGDGCEFLKNCTTSFDVIITDSSDPEVGEGLESKDGPAVTLFTEDFYSLLHARLSADGILASQGENMFLHKELIARLMKKSRSLYPVVDYAYTCTPTYPGGQIGFILCSKSEKTNFQVPVTEWSEEQLEKMQLKYYNSHIHRASFVLPTFMRKYLKENS